MCVIAYKAKDVRFPSKERVEEMWDANPDGAGIMWRDNKTNKIRFVKGFMRLNKLNKWIAKNRKWLEEVECALHFRITTHGGTSKGNCHPFVCDCDTDSHLLSGEADFVMMHNGVLPITPRKHDISDSAELALRIGRYQNPIDVMDVMDELCRGSRIIVMGPEGTMTYGDKFVTVQNDGLLYSNDHFVGYGDWYGLRYANMRPSGFTRRANPIDTSGIRTTDHKGIVKIGDVMDKVSEKFQLGASQTIIYDQNQGEFINPYTENVIPLEDVDPDMLSSHDYDIYLDLIEAKRNDEDEKGYDPEVVEEAHYYGMSVKEYMDYCYECGSNDNGCVSPDVAACM